MDIQRIKVSAEEAKKYANVSKAAGDDGFEATVFYNDNGEIDAERTYTLTERERLAPKKKKKFWDQDKIEDKLETAGETASAVGETIVEEFIDELPWPLNWLGYLLWWIAKGIWWIIKGVFWLISLPFRIFFGK